VNELFSPKTHHNIKTMAVQLAGVRNGLVGLGFTQAAALLAIVVDQGYDSLTAISELTDTTIAELISTVQKPGGTIPNPAGAVPATIPNPGTPIGHRASTNLKLGAFVARHYLRTSRPMDNPVQLLAPNNIHSFLGLKNSEDSYTAPIAVPILDRIEKIRDHIENINSHLLKTLGGHDTVGLRGPNRRCRYPNLARSPR
jgi:hypothetical protein